MKYFRSGKLVPFADVQQKSLEVINSAIKVWFYPMVRRSRRKSIFKSRIVLVLCGVSLGLLGRWVLGPPEAGLENPHQLKSVSPTGLETPPLELDLKRPNRYSPEGVEDPHQGLVPPIDLGDRVVDADIGELIPFDVRAVFHPHGEEVCASGCAASNHPTETLSRPRFLTLMNQWTGRSADPNASQSFNPIPGVKALDELLFFGPQTKRHLMASGNLDVDTNHFEFLRAELEKSHALVSIRVVDRGGECRTWIERASVPLDRRHVFAMETNNLQPLVTSGTVKRVGLKHVWARF